MGNGRILAEYGKRRGEWVMVEVRHNKGKEGRVGNGESGSGTRENKGEVGNGSSEAEQGKETVNW